MPGRKVRRDFRPFPFHSDASAGASYGSAPGGAPGGPVRRDDCGISELPSFRYHPDPVATGSVLVGDETCGACQRPRGFVYQGPVYSESSDPPTICPWCIADGSAARQFDAEFTDVGDVPDEVPAAVVELLARRTPGFSGWQQERWLYHCDDAAAYLGPVGWTEIEGHAEVVQALGEELAVDDWSEDDLAAHLHSLSATGSPSAHLFRCLDCGTYLAYLDLD